MKKKIKLTESEWISVFSIRCRSKSGQHVSPSEHDLCTRAIADDSKRYGDMDADVFDATAPFGSTARFPRARRKR